MISTLNAIKPSVAQVLEIDECLLTKGEGEVQKWIESGRGGPATPDYWAEKHSRSRQRGEQLPLTNTK